MFNNNIFGDRKITVEKAKIYEEIDLPTQNYRYSTAGNLSFNTSTKFLEYYDGSAWYALDKALPSGNLWQIVGANIQPILLYDINVGSISEKTLNAGISMEHKTIHKGGIYTDNIYEKTPLSGTTINNKLLVNNIGSFGTGDIDLNFSTQGNGCFAFNGDNITSGSIAKFYSNYPAIRTSVSVGQDDSFHTRIQWDTGGGGSIILKYTTDKTILSSTNTGTTGTILGIPITTSMISADNINFSPYTLRDLMNDQHSTGVLYAIPNITDLGTTFINCPACKVAIRATNDDTAKILILDVAATALLQIPSNSTRFLYISYSAGVASYNLQTSISTDYETNILVAKCYRVPDPLTEIYINKYVCSCIQNLQKKIINSTGVKQGEIHYQSGAILSFSGIQFAITAGFFQCAMNPINTSAKLLASNFTYLKYNGTGWDEVTQSSINNTQYQNPAGNFTNMTNNFYAVDFVYIMIDSKVYVIKSQSQANSLSNALSITVPTSIFPQRLNNSAVLCGKIVYKYNTTPIDSVYSAFSNATTYQGITNHSSLGNLSSDDHPQYAILNSTARTTTTDTLYINNISSWGTNQDLLYTTQGTGSHIFNCEPSPQSYARFIVKCPSMSDGNFIDIYVGKDPTSTLLEHMTMLGYNYKTNPALANSYFGINEGSGVDYRIYMYGSGAITSNALSLSLLNGVSTSGTDSFMKFGYSSTHSGYIHYVHDSVDASKYMSLGYTGYTCISQYGDGKAYFTGYNASISNVLSSNTVTAIGTNDAVTITSKGSGITKITRATAGNLLDIFPTTTNAGESNILRIGKDTNDNFVIDDSYDNVLGNTVNLSLYAGGVLKNYIRMYETYTLFSVKTQHNGGIESNSYTSQSGNNLVIDAASTKDINIGATNTATINLGRVGQICEAISNFKPTAFANASAVEGTLYYDSAVGEKCLKFRTDTAYITLGKSGSNDILSNTQDIKINKIVTKKIEPFNTKETVEINNLILSDNTSNKIGGMGYDDLGFYCINKNNMKIYFAGNNAVNNKHKIDPRLYAYLNDRFKILNERIEQLEKKIEELSSKKKDDVDDIDFSNTKLEDSFMDLTNQKK